MERHATAVWNGDLHHGGGSISVESGRLDEAHYSAKSRFEDEKGTNPEELLAAAHAGWIADLFGGLSTKDGTVLLDELAKLKRSIVGSLGKASRPA